MPDDTNRIGCLLRELYASAPLAFCILFLSLHSLGVATDLNAAISFAGGLTLRLLATSRLWSLPIFAYQDRWE